MGLFKRAAMLAGGIAAYRAWRKLRRAAPAAFAEGQGAPGNRAQVRDAGPGAMRDGEGQPWTSTDETSDESFPASDPPANY